MTSLRRGLLEGRRVAAGGMTDAVLAQLRALGASLPPLTDDVLADADAAAGWARAQTPLDALVFDAAGAFADAGLQPALATAWRAARAVATGAMIDGPRPGRLLFVAPRAGGGRHADAARAGLENLARTLSVEWARYGITAVAIAPGPAATDADVAELAAFLVSPAGGYFSGCRFDLR